MSTIKFIATFLLIGMANMANADWTKVTTTYQSIGYADLNSLQKNGDIAAMDILIDYEKPPFDGNNLAYRSIKINAEYNCSTKQFRVLKLTSYTENMATGQKPYSSDEPEEWQFISANSIQHGFWKKVCGK